MKKTLFLLCAFLLLVSSVSAVFAQTDSTELIDNGDGTYSLENGIFLREYDGYSEDAQLYLSALDACFTAIADYSPLLDAYIEEEKSFDDDQWNTIYSEIKYMSGKACSYVMYNDAPDDLSEHAYEIFYAAYHLMIANDLMLDAIQNSDANEAAIASYYYELADNTLGWWTE